MILVTPDPSLVVLQIQAQELDGSPKVALSSAKVRVYHVDVGGNEIEDLALTDLVHIGSSNTWRYLWAPSSLDVGQYFVEYQLVDLAGINFVAAEELRVMDIAQESNLSGLVSDIELLKKIETGRWQIINNQMIFYDTDNITPLLVFDLKDRDGNPTMDLVFERMPV